ncbi:hypothetical protein ABIB06_007375 [Bradyrhizobium sp. LB8.2]|uniref:HNH endonuclease n=1 Tax=unclassified Bradyrhizobium TaxID=2631580 RepID=UPI001FFC2899|nr:HNH endonuclease [Bradyrhizobium sp. 38]MCK1777694.1 HNH endonuclease [Bradyrhizobium sp. 132]
MGASYPTKILLAFRSGGICAFPGCAKPLVYTAIVGDDTAVGEAAHIAGEKPAAARYDATMTDAQRDHVDNLIYMCEGDHTVIDKVPADWPTANLLALKATHEEKASAAIAEAFSDVAFPELQHAVAWVSSQPPATVSGPNFDLLPPEEKIKKNDLSNGSRHTIAAGLSSRTTVADFVAAETQLDPDFPDKLKSGFLAEYFRLRHQGHKGNELFELMCAFSQRGLKSQGDRTAGLAVLIYLFEICDVFEK